MAFLLPWANQNNNRVTASISSAAVDGSRKADDLLCDNDASYDTGGGSVSVPYANLKDAAYNSSAMLATGARGVGWHKKYNLYKMLRLRKIYKALGQNRGTYNASTTVQS